MADYAVRLLPDVDKVLFLATGDGVVTVLDYSTGKKTVGVLYPPQK